MSSYLWETKLECGVFGDLPAMVDGQMWGRGYVETEITSVKVWLGNQWQEVLKDLPQERVRELEADFSERFWFDYVGGL